MKISFFGTGYVGLVTGACLAELGHDILCMDIDPQKIEKLNHGIIPIYEPGLDEIVKRQMQTGRLQFTNDVKVAIDHGQALFICVSTPMSETGAADTRYVFSVAKSIGQLMQTPKLIINKSTAPIGTAVKIKEIIATELQQRNQALSFDIAVNPEFLKEGTAVIDFMQPDRIVYGYETENAKKLIEEIYAPFNLVTEKRIGMDLISAELTKYAANAMLATKISFINEIANIAERVGADIDHIRKGIGSDPRIGPLFIAPGCGYGGSCFPKDVQALIYTAENIGIKPNLLQAVETVNYQQKRKLFEFIQHYFKGDIQGKTFAVWGLAFKPNTDDIREASSRVLLEMLWQYGVTVKAYDPVAMPAIEKHYGHRNDLKLCADPLTCLAQADALILVTEWPQFKEIDYDNIAKKLNHRVIFDGRNLFDPTALKKLGFNYFGIGKK